MHDCESVWIYVRQHLTKTLQTFPLMCIFLLAAGLSLLKPVDQAAVDAGNPDTVRVAPVIV